MTRYIDMTPTWGQAARIIAAALENGTDKGRDAARTELFRMAELIDQLTAERAELESPARFDVIADGYTCPPFGQSFADSADAARYATTLQAHGYTVQSLPAVEAVTANDALRIAADHFAHAELAETAE